MNIKTLDTSSPKNFFGTSELRLKEIFSDWEVETYRIHQVFTWVYHYHCRDFNEMTNLSKSLRSRLAENFYFVLPKIQSRTQSKDGSINIYLNWMMERLLKVSGCHQIPETLYAFLHKWGAV